MFGKKCKLFVSTLLTAAICISFSSVGSMALSKPQNHKAPQTQSMTEKFENSVKQQLSKKGLQLMATQKKKAGSVKLQSALAPLTNAYIDAITSETSALEHPDAKGFDEVDYGQWGKTTKFHHGGKAEILVIEIGFSNTGSRKGTYNGTKLDYTEYVLASGNIAYGMAFIYKIPNVNGGTFDYQSTSEVAPFNTFHDWLNIN